MTLIESPTTWVSRRPRSVPPIYCGSLITGASAAVGQNPGDVRKGRRHHHRDDHQADRDAEWARRWPTTRLPEHTLSNCTVIATMPTRMLTHRCQGHPRAVPDRHSGTGCPLNRHGVLGGRAS